MPMRHLLLLFVSVLTFAVGLAPAAVASQAVSVSSAPAAESSSAAQSRAPRVNIRREFNLATFNVLGNRHTTGANPRFDSGAERMRLTVKAFRHRDIDVVALQEFEIQQHRAFRRLTDGRYRVWSDEKDIANAVAWRTSKFKFVRARTIGVPYFHGNIVQMPVVFLRLRSTGQQMAFTSFHNPVTNKKRRDSAKWRRKGTTREIKLINNVERRGTPAFLGGDFNDRTERWQCRVARATNMVTAGNGDPRGGSCKPLDRMRIDWLFGSNGVDFSRYRAVESKRVNRASDHPLIVVRVR